MDILQIKELHKVYGKNELTNALNGITFSIQAKERVGIMGPSGSGKTTLLNIISTIDEPTSGKIVLTGEDAQQLSLKQRSHFRRKLGFVFQDFHLLYNLTVRENITLPLVMRQESKMLITERLVVLAKQLDIQSILDKYPFELSGGQAQRVAIARAIIHQPSLILADEPTGNLDSKASRNVMELLCSVQETEESTLLLVTHDPVVASYCHRVLFIKDGKLVNEIHLGANRQTFFQSIINTLSLLEGDLG
ncbi:ABC transporter ATP-binding protein [Shimazuella sp. AN120528]|uniref:ABC transporter ATP-binding protein n=1 Tax=Shimazuella soli TaxID=1892854 RepID=UPI001F116380|nr:ABC transporter ATP-binding protein [Shimazuella soli]MCH5583984.1 ABC transporter ATP-binding protein [Shimazuella soli]